MWTCRRKVIFRCFVICWYSLSINLCIGSSDAVLAYSTFLGPRENNYSYMKYIAIGADAFGCAVVSTSMPVSGFPTTADALQSNLSQTALTKLSADGSSLIYSSFFGAPPGRHTVGTDMALDREGNVYLVGINTDDNFPATPGAFEPEPIGPFPRSYHHDGFLIKFDPTLKHILYGTFLGDNAWDEVIAVALDPQGNAYATGDVGYRIKKELRRIYKINLQTGSHGQPDALGHLPGGKWQRPHKGPGRRCRGERVRNRPYEVE